MADCCPFCGAELSFAAERCRDCNLSQDPGAPPALQPDDASDEVAYEVADWPVGTRLRLTSLLAERGVPWRWEPGLNLVVLEDDDVRTEAVLDEIEAEELGTAASNTPDNGDVEGDWDEDADEDGDVIDEDDDEEEYADDADDDYEDDEVDDDDGAVAQAAMADLFVAADRLIHDPENLAFAVDLDTAADVINASPAPFGIDEATWSAIRERAAAVRVALDEPEADQADQAEAAVDDGTDGLGLDPDALADAVVSERAQVLRDTIRPWV